VYISCLKHGCCMLAAIWLYLLYVLSISPTTWSSHRAIIPFYYHSPMHLSTIYVIYLVIISCKMQTYGDPVLDIYHRFLRRRFFGRSVSRFNMKCSYNAGEMSEDQLCVPSLNKTKYSVCPLDCR